MNGEGMYIDPASLQNLKVNFARFRAEVLRSAAEGLRDYGMRIVAKAKELLKANGSVATGLLRNSGRTVSQPDGTVDAGFYANYAEYVEYGRKAGGMPPVDSIYEWVRKKGKRKNSALKAAAVFTGKSEESLARDAAWAIAKSIKEHGTQPHPFLKPAYEQYRNSIDEFMQRKVNKTVESFTPKK